MMGNENSWEKDHPHYVESLEATKVAHNSGREQAPKYVRIHEDIWCNETNKIIGEKIASVIIYWSEYLERWVIECEIIPRDGEDLKARLDASACSSFIASRTSQTAESNRPVAHKREKKKHE